MLIKGVLISGVVFFFYTLLDVVHTTLLILILIEGVWLIKMMYILGHIIVSYIEIECLLNIYTEV